jgi:hypothetical protein
VIDPRGQRFAATLTTLVLAGVLVLDSPWLLAGQAVIFALGAFRGPASTPYAVLYRTTVRPRIGAPSALEHVEPPRFAQAVGLGFASIGLLGYAVGVDAVALVAVAAALAAAFLNAAFGYCLGCEVYLWLQRTRVAWRPVTAAGSALTNKRAAEQPADHASQPRAAG